MRSCLFACFNGIEESNDLVKIHIAVGGYPFFCNEFAVLNGEHSEVSAVVKADTCLGTDEIKVLILVLDILSPSALKRDDGACGTDKGGNRVVNVEGAVYVAGIFAPHISVLIVFNITAELRECNCRYGLDLGVAETVHYLVDTVNAPVDENAAAGYCLSCELTAKTGNGAVLTEADEYVINLAKLACKDTTSYLLNSLVEAAYNADGKNLSCFVLCLLHLKSLGVDTSCGLLAENVLSCSESLDGDLLVHEVVSTNGDSINLGIVDGVTVILDSDTAAVISNALISLFLDDIAEILDLALIRELKSFCISCISFMLKSAIL